MRFDKTIKLITLSVEEDGLGGRTEVENVIIETMCNFEELSLETERIPSIRATELTVDKHYTVHIADVTKAIKITNA